MASPSSSSSLECPVCREEFNNPKLLTCNHVVCGKCVVDALIKAGHGAECPLCRAPVLSPSASLEGDLELLVDDLPTDLSIVARVESKTILSSRHVCSGCGDNEPAASFCFQCDMKLCDKCAGLHNKFPAMRHHVVETLDSLTPERLAEINRSTCMACKSHNDGDTDRLAEAYCSAHQELICMLCATAFHAACGEVKAISEAGMEKRKEFRHEAQKLREKEAALRTQIKQAKEKLSAMRAEANGIFDKLSQRVERRRQEVNDLILAEQVEMELPQLDRVRAALMSQIRVLDSLVGSTPDDALLDMGQAVESRLDHLHQQTGWTYEVQGPADIGFDPYLLRRLESGIAALGCLQPRSDLATPSAPSQETVEHSEAASFSSVPTPSSWPEPPPPPYSSTLPPAESPPRSSSSSSSSSPTSTSPIPCGPPPPYSSLLPQPKMPPSSTSSSSSAPAVLRPSAHCCSSVSSSSFSSSARSPPSPTRREPKPRGAYLAAVLKKGDRVTRSKDMWPRVKGDSDHGTVSSIPSQLRQSREEDPGGFVDVVWDNGEELCHWMGRFGRYELELL